MTARFHILDFTDRRAVDLIERGRVIAQEQADLRVLQDFDRAVRADIARRREKDPQYLSGLFWQGRPLS